MQAAAIALIVASYLVGSCPTAYLVARWRQGIDIRQYGTGNVGGTNVGVQIGMWATVLVGIADIVKGALPVWVALAVGQGAGVAAMAGLAAVAGHDWSVFLGFKGGRGMATTLGCLLVLAPWGTLVVLASLLIGRLIGLTALVNGIGVAILPFIALYRHQSMTIVLLCVALVVLTLVKRLLANGEPYPVGLSPSRVRLNRILYDRDVGPSAQWGSRGERRPER